MNEEEKEKRKMEGGKMLYWIVNALEYLVKKGIALVILLTFSSHDIFFGTEGMIVIGLYALGSKGKKSWKEKKETEYHRWMAPEAIKGELKEATESSLSFAVGMISYEVLTFKQPFDDCDGEEAGVRIKKGERPNLDLLDESPLKSIIEKCLQENPVKRPSFDELKRTLSAYLPQPVAVEGESPITKLPDETDTNLTKLWSKNPR